MLKNLHKIQLCKFLVFEERAGQNDSTVPLLGNICRLEYQAMPVSQYMIANYDHSVILVP